MKHRATWWQQATSGVNYVRAWMPAKHLPGKCVDLTPNDIVEVSPDVYSFPRQEGAAIWMFSGNTTRGLLMREQQEQGIPVFFEADDNYTIPPDVPQYSAWKTKFDKTDSHSYEVATRIASWTDGVICSTPKLAEVYGELNDNVHVARNCVDPDDWDELDKPDDGILRIGWAASDSHRKDAPLLKQAFRWLYGRPNVELIVIGITTASFPVPYVHIPWMDSLGAYRKVLQTLDVMLCPLQRTDWADCKSDIKAVDAAMGGAMSVVSGSPAYDLWHDKTFVCDTEQDFKKVAKHLYRNRDEVKELQAAHREYVMSERTIQKGISQWEQAITSVTSKQTTPSSSTLVAVGSAT